MKVIVIGCPGSGKSTFSKILHNITKIPIYHLDMLNWKENKTTIDKTLFRQKMLEVIKKKEWIIDGNYGSTIELRIKECNIVFFLDYPTDICLKGIKDRVGKERDDIPFVECEIDDDLVEFVKNFGYTTRPNIINLLKKYKDKKIIILKNREEGNDYLKNLKCKEDLLC